MSQDFTQDLSKNMDFISNYDLLQKIGVLDKLEQSNNQVKILERQMEEAIEIFKKRDIDNLIDYLTQEIMNRVIPEYFAFILQGDTSSAKPVIHCFEKLQPIEPLFELPSIETYQHFFSLSPTTVTFPVFEYMVGRKELTDVFKVLNPRLVLPILGLDGVYGFIIVGAKVMGESYSREEITDMDTMMKFVSMSVQNIIHYNRAVTDFKTSLYNHSYFLLRLEEELARVYRYNTSLAILMFDVDKFKNFNDTYGHLAGDEILSHLARILREAIREEDTAARFGGEEFIILLVQCNADAAKIVAERIRRTIENFSLPYDKHILRATISIGIRQVDNSCRLEASSVIEQADKALYASKENGRNQSTVYDPALHEDIEPD